MKIIDAHHHLWSPESDPGNIAYVWLKKIGAPKPFGDPTAIQRDYLVDEFCNESHSHQLIGSVHVQADGAIADPLKESEWLESVAKNSGLPTAHIGFLDLTSEKSAAQLKAYCQMPRFRGIRQILSRIDSRPDISFAPVHYLEDSRWRENFSLLEKHGLSFDLQLYPEQMGEAADFFSRFPDVPLVIDHCGSPYDLTPQGFSFWKQQLQLVSALPNCCMKISGLGMFDRRWTQTSAQPLIDSLLELFGSERLMFGSNFPVDKLMKSYAETVDDVHQALVCAGLYSHQIQSIFLENCKRFYRLDDALLTQNRE